MTENEAQKQSGEIISNALSAASEILSLPNRPAQDMIDLSQKIADRIIQTAKELSGSGVKSTVNVQHERVNSSEIVLIRNILEEYSNNPIIAKRIYEGKRLTFQGEIKDIKINENRLQLILYSEHYEADYYILDCYFSPGWRNIILKLRYGQTITVNGEWHYGGFNDGDLLYCKLGGDRKPTSQTSEITSTRHILKEYDDNSIVAQRKYERKRLTFQGKIEHIGETFRERHKSFCVKILVDGCYIFCYFASKYENIILSLKKGQILTVNGKWHYNGSVELDDCEIVSAK